LKFRLTTTTLEQNKRLGSPDDLPRVFRASPGFRGFSGFPGKHTADFYLARYLAVNTTLLVQWQRLLFPPEPLPVRAGEQLNTGNRYPDVRGVPHWEAHQGGTRTYAVNPVYPGPDGGGLCKFAVLDLDEGGDSLPKARALLELCRLAGLAALPAWSGSKGCHVWLFFEPASVSLATAVLKRLKAAVPFQGELIPGDLMRVKVPPAMHQERRLWAFFLEPLPEHPPELKTAPTGFLDSQAGILAKVVPTPVARLSAYANAGGERREPQPESDMQPDLAKLGGHLAPCIAALVEQGAKPELGSSWDKQALTLKRYAITAGIDDKAGLSLLKTLSDNSPDFPTKKDWNAKARHWHSIKEPGPFRCGFLLPARQALGFRCSECAARPAGVKVGKAEPNPRPRETLRDNAKAVPDTSPALFLEPALADSLLQLALQAGLPEARISPAIFPETPLPGNDPKTGKPATAALHALGWQGIQAGSRTPAAILNVLDRQPYPPALVAKAALAALVTRLIGCPLLPEPEQAALIERASDLTARRDLLAALGTGTTATNQGKPMQAVIGGLHETTARLQQAAGTAWGSPLAAYATELLEGLITTERATVPTPFDTLNSLLGGGLQAGKLYVLAAPPGGGKTTLSCQIADFAASKGCPVAYVAMEMGRAQLFDYALARSLGMNSAKVEAKQFRHSPLESAQLATAAQAYLETIAPYLAVIEGDWTTTPATLAAWVAGAKARYAVTADNPVLVIVDYLQLLNTGLSELDGGTSGETPKISQVAVQLKQLARDSGVAVLALSDIVKSEQGEAFKGKEFTLNMLRGSNRIAHAADTVLALYSEAAQADGGKAGNDPWQMLAGKYADSARARDFLRSLDDLRHAHPTGGDSAAVYSRLELLKNRGGRGRGSQVLLYQRAYHRFIGLSVPGQDTAEGRGSWTACTNS